MPLQSAAIQSGATWSSTGGTSVSFAPDGRPVQDGVRLVVTGDTNLLTRRSLVAKSTLPAPPPSVGAAARLGKNGIVYSVPFIAADGRTYNQTVRIEMSLHAEYSVANKTALKADAAALLVDSDFDNFWVSSLLT